MAADNSPITLGDAVRALEAGKVEEGYLMLREIVSREPGNRAAVLRLQQVENQRRAAEAKVQQLSAIRLPRVQFRDVSLNDALGQIARAVRQASSDQSNLNMVRLYPPEEGERRRVNLELTNVPAWFALSMVAEQTGVRLVPETHAIKVTLPIE